MKSLSTGPLTKESRMFSDTKAARDKGDQNYDYFNWIINDIENKKFQIKQVTASFDLNKLMK